jgi:hypothetical protein
VAHFACRLKGLYKAQFLLRYDAGKDVDVPDAAASSLALKPASSAPVMT